MAFFKFSINIKWFKFALIAPAVYLTIFVAQETENIIIRLDLFFWIKLNPPHCCFFLLSFFFFFLLYVYVLIWVYLCWNCWCGIYPPFPPLYGLLTLGLQRVFRPAKPNLWTQRIKMGRMRKRHAADLCGERVQHSSGTHFQKINFTRVAGLPSVEQIFFQFHENRLIKINSFPQFIISSFCYRILVLTFTPVIFFLSVKKFLSQSSGQYLSLYAQLQRSQSHYYDCHLNILFA